MKRKILVLIVFLIINMVFNELKGSPTKADLIQEKGITAELVKTCLEKILNLDRHYWYFFAPDIAQELSANPSIWNSTKNHYITVTEREKNLSQLMKDLQTIAASYNGTSPLKQKFANVVRIIYDKHYSQCRREQNRYYSFNLFLNPYTD